jgi:hypothetical protein
MRQRKGTGRSEGIVSEADLPDLSRTARAIEERDRRMPILDEEFDRCVGMADAARCKAVFAQIEALESAVGEAFGEDTKDRNDPKTCAECVRAGPPTPPPGFEISFVRRMVALWKEKKPEREAMRISDLQDNQVVRARWGRAGRTAPDFGPWRDAPLYVQRDNKGNVVVVALRLPPGEDWAEYNPRDFQGGLFVAEDYYLEIEGLAQG